MLYSKSLSTPAIEYGKGFEDVCRRRFEEETGLLVNMIGLFPDVEHGFLGASPDGLIGEDELIEIKCAYSLHLKNQDIHDAIPNNKQFYLKYNDVGQAVLKSHHNYYYQVAITST
ncbi:exonuclease phage-type/recb c-terminal domain-containing protein [Holotrichia oblita]|uniref:Exonuclease phage-type/recb c-terminal domain-containing protein n=1 Tax=Holotrichia oblita TaxID=644536 RepID=A0ACB9TPA4_HOLOL|nr:exonuclease phage-type/recb c-terminal domain-containing protein [Holotrichia oblita]